VAVVLCFTLSAVIGVSAIAADTASPGAFDYVCEGDASQLTSLGSQGLRGARLLSMNRTEFRALAFAIFQSIKGELLRRMPIPFATGENTGVSDGQRIVNVQYIRTNGFRVEGSGYPVVTVINSRDDLESYYGYSRSANGNSRSTYSDSYAELVDAFGHYTDEYFMNGYLVLILLEENSGSIRHEVSGVGDNGDISIRRLIPEIGTSDMAQWHIIIEFDIAFRPDAFNVLHHS